MKPKLNKWQIWFKPFQVRTMRIDPPGWHLFNAGIVKLHSLPENGCAVTKDHYYGFRILFIWWLPIDKA